MRTPFNVFFVILFSTFLTFSDSVSQIPDTLAIAPFHVVGETKNPELFRFGFPDGLAHILQRYDGVIIVSRIRLADVLQELRLLQTGLMNIDDAQKVGQILPADGIVTGTIYKSGNNLRVNIHLINVHTGELAVEMTMEGIIEEPVKIFDFQETVSIKFANRLKLALKAEQKGTSVKKFKPSLDAYEHFIKALSYLYRGDKDKAKKEGEWALKIDPGFSQAQTFEEELDEAFEELERVMEEMDKEIRGKK